MDEGVDPTHMCQNLVDKVAQSRQLRAVTEPGLLALFEDWLEELEAGVIRCVEERGEVDPRHVAADLGLSMSGANFLIAKLTREGKIAS